MTEPATCALLLLLLLLLLQSPPARSDAYWLQFTPVSIPAGVQKHQALVYSDVVVIIGGCNASGMALPYVYTFAPSTGSAGTWTQRSANLPLIWHSASMLQAPMAVVFGGIDVHSGNFSARTYTFDLATYAFAEVVMSAAPPARCLHATAASSSSTVILFGGLSSTGLPPLIRLRSRLNTVYRSPTWRFVAVLFLRPVLVSVVYFCHKAQPSLWPLARSFLLLLLHHLLVSLLLLFPSSPLLLLLPP
jgi:hypothetical protein